MSSSKTFNIGLAGFGVVGSGLCRLLVDNADIVRERCGRTFAVRTILVRDAKKKREVAPPEGSQLVTDPQALVNDPEIDAVVELMGGIEPARTLVEQALASGKDVVTANKALLAEFGLRLFEQAAASRRVLRYEASVAGAIPVVGMLKDSIAGNRVQALTGILNGTSNYILSEMTAHNLEFEFALRQAQELGYAEADPALDIDGLDAAHKLVILIRLAFGQNYPLDKLSVTGIRRVSALDIRLAREFGYRIKLIGEVRSLADESGQPTLAAGVFPALIPHNRLLARVGGAFNALHVSANAAGPLFFHGRGAGSLPTAGAVLADLIAVARGECSPNTGFAAGALHPARRLPPEEWRANYYVRAIVEDAPGVLRDMSGCLAAEGISVAQMIQKREAAPSGVPIVFMTHETTDRAMRDAMNRVVEKGLVRGEPVCMRVLDKD